MSPGPLGSLGASESLYRVLCVAASWMSLGSGPTLDWGSSTWQLADLGQVPGPHSLCPQWG